MSVARRWLPGAGLALRRVVSVSLPWRRLLLLLLLGDGGDGLLGDDARVRQDRRRRAEATQRLQHACNHGNKKSVVTVATRCWQGRKTSRGAIS